MCREALSEMITTSCSLLRTLADPAKSATPSLFFLLLLNRGPVSRGHILLIDMRHSGHMDTSGGDICEMIDEFVVICKLLAGGRVGGVGR